MVGFKKPCKYCNQLVDADAYVCPNCGKVNPLDTTRCPKCRAPTQEGQKACQHCGLVLTTVCPQCSKPTFFGDYCQNCGGSLLVTCPKCKKQQPPLGDRCIYCKKPLSGGKK